MALIDELKERRNLQADCCIELNTAIWEQEKLLHSAKALLIDIDIAIAALEPAEPVSDNVSALAEFMNAKGEPVNAAELPKVELKWDDGFGPAEPEAEPEPSLFDEGAIDIQTALPVEQEPDVIFAESGLHGDLEPTEIDAEPPSVTQDPEFLAAVQRAEATLAAEPAAYVGLNDPELDAEWDAMKAREEAEKPKPRFSIFGRIKEDA